MAIQHWEKLGLIISPNEKISWMNSHVGASFVCIDEDKELVKVYISGRDLNNVSRIGLAELCIKDLSTVKNIYSEPIFSIGEPGCFDESGITYPWIVEHASQKFMYYVGWVAGGLGGFQNFVGLATSKEADKYQRYSKAPILNRSNEEPIGNGSVAVIKEKDHWKMWYTSFDKWQEFDGKNYHFYNIKYAESKDGIYWDRQQSIAIDYKDKFENTIGKPMVFIEDGIYKMYYCYRAINTNYKIGYAESKDAKNWQRLDENIVFVDSQKSLNEDWDSEMQEYAYVFNIGSEKYMVYNGNGFGKTGLGLARLKI